MHKTSPWTTRLKIWGLTVALQQIAATVMVLLQPAANPREMLPYANGLENCAAAGGLRGSLVESGTAADDDTNAGQCVLRHISAPPAERLVHANNQ
jgi:hypothetical protein